MCIREREREDDGKKYNKLRFMLVMYMFYVERPRRLTHINSLDETRRCMTCVIRVAWDGCDGRERTSERERGVAWKCVLWRRKKCFRFFFSCALSSAIRRNFLIVHSCCSNKINYCALLHTALLLLFILRFNYIGGGNDDDDDDCRAHNMPSTEREETM